MSTVLPPGGPGDGPFKRRQRNIELKDVALETSVQGQPIVIKLSDQIKKHFESLQEQPYSVNKVSLLQKIAYLLEVFEVMKKESQEERYTLEEDNIFDIQDDDRSDNSGLFFPALENYSFLCSGLNKEKREELKRSIIDLRFGGWQRDTNNEAAFLNAGFYLITRLSLIHASVKKSTEFSDEIKKDHLELLDTLRTIVVSDLNYCFEEGDLTIHPRNYFRDKLKSLQLAKEHKELSYLFNLDVQWRELAEEGNNSYYRIIGEADEVERPEDYSSDNSKSIQESLAYQQKQQKLLEAISPSTREKSFALSNPIEYVSSIAANADITCINLSDSFSPDFISMNLKKIISVHQSIIESLRKGGYKRFAIETYPYLYPVFKLKNNNDEDKSMNELTETIRNLFKDKSRKPDFRMELDLPLSEDNEPIDAFIELLDDLWNMLHKQGDIELFFYHSSRFEEASEMTSWISTDPTKKQMIIKMSGYNFPYTPLKIAYIRHTIGVENYDPAEDEFEMEFEIGKALHQISKNQDLGSDNTTSVPVKNNSDLLKLTAEDNVFDNDVSDVNPAEVLVIDVTADTKSSVLLDLIPEEDLDAFSDINNSLYYFVSSRGQSSDKKYPTKYPIDACLVTLYGDNDDDNDFSETIDPTVNTGNPLVLV